MFDTSGTRAGVGEFRCGCFLRPAPIDPMLLGYVSLAKHWSFIPKITGFGGKEVRAVLSHVLLPERLENGSVRTSFDSSGVVN